MPTARMKIRLQTFSYRFAEQVLNDKVGIKQEIEEILVDPNIPVKELTPSRFKKGLEQMFLDEGWEIQPTFWGEPRNPSAKMDFLKERVGVEVGFAHASFMVLDLLKFQMSSQSGLDEIDVGVYVVTTTEFQKGMTKRLGLDWGSSLTYEKVVSYLPHFKSAIQIPIYVIGIDL